MDRDERLLTALESQWGELAAAVAECRPQAAAEEVEHLSRRLVERLAFLAMCRRRAILSDIPSRLTAGLPDVPPDVASFGGSIERLLSEIADEVAGQPADWLGRLHERLLGRQLVRTPAGRFEPRTARSARKAAGVFYTPDFVVRYIVSRSLRRMLDEQPEPPWPRVMDPACGSGAFLTAACRSLVEQSRRRPGNDLWAVPEIVDSLSGIELDADAVLAARRSLWLAVVDAHGTGTAEAAAGRLAENVRWGDALADAVPETAGRFDVVIGNPPYRRELGTKRLLDELGNTRLAVQFRQPRMDLWYYFVHRGLELLKPGGRLAMIVGAYWTAGSGSKKLLAAIRKEAEIEEIFLLDRLRVFAGVGGRHMILTLRKKPCEGAGRTTIRRVPADSRQGAEPYVRGSAPVDVFEKDAEQLFRFGRIDLEPPADELLAKIGRGEPLGRLGVVRQGIVENPASVTAAMNRRHKNRWRTGAGVFALAAGELAGLELPDNEMALLRPYHDLCDLGRHFLAARPSLALIYATPETCPEIDRFPRLRRHLEQFRPIMAARRETLAGRRAWWQLHWPREERLWRSAKVISVQMGRRPAFVAATEPVYVPFSTNVFVPADATREHVDYFAVVLGSRLVWKWYRHSAKHRGTGLEINGHVLGQTPVRRIDFSSPADRRRHDELVALVERMKVLTREAGGDLQRNEATPPDGFAEIDRRIDELVYELYALTDGEIRAVNG
jgi:hypothetical protein